MSTFEYYIKSAILIIIIIIIIIIITLILNGLFVVLYSLKPTFSCIILILATTSHDGAFDSSLDRLNENLSNTSLENKGIGQCHVL